MAPRKSSLEGTRSTAMATGSRDALTDWSHAIAEADQGFGSFCSWSSGSFGSSGMMTLMLFRRIDNTSLSGK